MTKAKQKKFLSKLFLHLDGIALIPTILALEEMKILQNFKKTNLSKLSKIYNANSAYLNVALRILCSQGFMQCEIAKNNEVDFWLTKDNYNFDEIINTYNIVNQLFKHPIDYTIILKNITEKEAVSSTLFEVLNKYNYHLNLHSWSYSKYHD